MGLTYKRAGVDVDKAEAFVKSIKPLVKATLTKGALGEIGSFGGMFEFDKLRYKNPVLVSSTDGVGTKLKIAFLANKHDTVGIDCVAMNVNDILCSGAKPLFFLDYLGVGKLTPTVLKDVVKGIAQGCRDAGCALIGGETAEMPGIYKEGEYDIAGFCVGVVEKGEIIDGKNIAVGDAIVGIESSGLHSNGFSLVRKVFTEREQKKLLSELLKPTRIYAKPIISLLAPVGGLRSPIKAIAHITGGAFYQKLPRIVPKNKAFLLRKGSWHVPYIFKMIKQKGAVDDKEMYRTFNMGLGMVLVCDAHSVHRITRYMSNFRLKAYRIGEVIKGDGEVKIV